jgi:CheY-like chemotaxis protein
MSAPQKPGRYRLLVVDDNRAIHEDFRKILAPDMELKQLDEIEADLFGKTIEISAHQDFDIDSAFQGEEGLACVQSALRENRPYSLAFIDMRMPPGWNGIETIEHVWDADPQLQIVICSAYSDHSWAEISQRLGNNDRLLILKKPFDNVEILQMAYAMSSKCELARQHKLWQVKGTVDNKQPESVKEIKESVNLLQRSFEQLSEPLTRLRNALLENSGLLTEQFVQDLFDSTDIPELEQLIPNTFNRLYLELEKIGSKNTGITVNTNDPLH